MSSTITTKQQMAARATAWEAVEAVEAAAMAEATAWSNFDPCGLLERLVKIGNNAQEAV
jgi:hypothetical protein